MTATRSVLFDLDGTLVDTAPDLIYALNLLLIEQDKRPVKPESIRPHVSGGSAAIIRAGLGDTATDSQIEQLKPRYLEIYRDNICQYSRLFPQMDQVIEQLEQRGIPWVIVTNKPSALTTPLLEAMQLAERCCSVVSADTTTYKKPHPEPLLYACDECDITPENCIYVGDDKRDILAGNTAGMLTLAASWGYFLPEDRIEDWPACAVINQPLEILDWV